MEDFDLIIDEALESYSAHAASLGLERRIMSQVQERPVRFRWWPCLALALALLIAVPGKVPRQPIPVRAPEQVVVSTPVAIPAKPRRRHRKVMPPELALVAWLDNHPEEAAHLFPGNKPITIEPISIPELPTGEKP